MFYIFLKMTITFMFFIGSDSLVYFFKDLCDRIFTSKWIRIKFRNTFPSLSCIIMGIEYLLNVFHSSSIFVQSFALIICMKHHLRYSFCLLISSLFWYEHIAFKLKLMHKNNLTLPFFSFNFDKESHFTCVKMTYWSLINTKFLLWVLDRSTIALEVSRW